MIRLKKAAAAAIAAVMLTLCCSCTQNLDSYEHNSNTKLSFSWWGKDVRHRYTTEAIEIFESENEGISVYPRYAEWAGYKSRMDTKILSGDEADVMQMNFGWLYEYTGNGFEFYDLEKLSDIINLDSFEESVLDYGRINGKLIGIPISMNAQTVYLNKTLLDSYGIAEPKSWEDYFAAAEVLGKDGIYMLRLSKSSAWHLCIAYAEQETGKRFLDGEGNIGFEPQDIKVMFDFYKDMLDKGVTKLPDDRDRKDLEDGKAAGTVMWISDAEYYVAPCRDKGNEIVVADYPEKSGAEVYGWYAKPTSLYCISKNTKYPEAAARLVEFLLSSREMSKLRGLENGVPASKSALEVLEANDMIDGIQQDADNMRKKHTPSVKLLSPYTETAAFMEKYDALINDIVSGDKDTAAAAQELYELVNETLVEA